MSTLTRLRLSALVLSLAFTAASGTAQSKQVVRTQSDLPRFSFPLNQPASQLLTASDKQFDPFLSKVEADVNSVLANYTITDKATLRELLGTRLDGQVLNGDLTGARATVDKIRELQEKPEAKLTAGMLTLAMIRAAEESHATSGPAFDQAFKKHFSEELKVLPWATTQNTLKEMRESFELLSPNLLAGSAKQSLDPQVEKTGALDLPGAQSLIGMREEAKVILPLTKPALSVLSPYIAAHEVKKPDIWADRDVTLTSQDKLTPVRIAIFDSGVDTALYPGRVYTDPHPDHHSPHGLAFDIHGNLYDAVLQPLTPKQKAEYPKVLSLLQGLDDLQAGIDSPAAAQARKTLAGMPPDKIAAFLKQLDFLGQYLHGTHVAGIAVRGNPAARLVVMLFNDELPDMPFPPSVAWAEKFKSDFLEIGNYLREHNVRVVNMSWGDNQKEFEQWLVKTSSIKDPQKRKELAGQIYDVWRDAIAGAIKAAPNTLWVCAAGNSDSNASFSGDVPASLQLPNLVTVGAVDQAGDETSFTSYGGTVVLYADGYEVKSYVPGGMKLRLSGTSMASPNVANLAGKLFALDPKLTPEQAIALMKQGATSSNNGRLHLIDPKATIALLRKQHTTN